MSAKKTEVIVHDHPIYSPVSLGDVELGSFVDLPKRSGHIHGTVLVLGDCPDNPGIDRRVVAVACDQVRFGFEMSIGKNARVRLRDRVTIFMGDGLTRTEQDAG